MEDRIIFSLELSTCVMVIAVMQTVHDKNKLVIQAVNKHTFHVDLKQWVIDFLERLCFLTYYLSYQVSFCFARGRLSFLEINTF